MRLSIVALFRVRVEQRVTFKPRYAPACPLKGLQNLGKNVERCRDEVFMLRQTHATSPDKKNNPPKKNPRESSRAQEKGALRLPAS